MEQVIKVVSRITLYEGYGKRQTSFESGYRPLFDFSDAKTKISGMIYLVEKKSFSPGETGIVRISFLRGIVKEDSFRPGQRFTFGEGQGALGEGEILEQIENN